MYSVLGVNEISIELSKKLNPNMIIGPYPLRLGRYHLNTTLSYLTIPRVIPSDSNILIDLSFNTIISLILNDFALSKGKSLVSVVNYNGKILVKNIKENSCLGCLFESNSRKYILNYVILMSIIRDSRRLISVVEEAISSQKDFIITEDKVEEFKFTKGCNSCKNVDFRFLEGEYGEMVNENCGNDLSAVFPIDDREIDIDYLSRFLKIYGVNVIEESDEYINFEAEGKKMFVFKNGRLMISKVETKEEAEYYFRKYVGS
ncbi:MAG: hypothetical protein ACP5PT_01835 [Brevinematia bacterium]